MTRDDIIKMAREAGFWQEHIDTWMCNTKDIEQLAALVAAAEREACAVYLERGVDLSGLDGHPGWQRYSADLLEGCAAAIRARGQE